MDFVVSLLMKNWKAVLAVVAVAVTAAFFQFQLMVADGKYKDIVSQRDAAQVERQQWYDSHTKLQAALQGVEADKKTLQDKLAQASESARIAAKAAAQNASEAARVTALLRQIRESSNDPVYAERHRSLGIDWLRERAASGASAPDRR